MSSLGNITEINVTTTQAKSGNFSNYCPHAAGTGERRAWFQYLAFELNRSVGAGKTFKLVCSDETYYFDRSLMTSVTITYT